LLITVSPYSPGVFPENAPPVLVTAVMFGWSWPTGDMKGFGPAEEMGSRRTSAVVSWICDWVWWKIDQARAMTTNPTKLLPARVSLLDTGHSALMLSRGSLQ
jgi:hypothetical protein